MKGNTCALLPAQITFESREEKERQRKKDAPYLLTPLMLSTMAVYLLLSWLLVCRQKPEWSQKPYWQLHHQSQSPGEHLTLLKKHSISAMSAPQRGR